MIGIYQDSFIEYLRDNLGDPIKIKPKNIVCRCPWCEYGKTKDHYHLWISTEAPIFHCFHADCEQRGEIGKLLKKIGGLDESNKYVDVSKIQKSEKINIEADVINTEQNKKQVIIPELYPESFPYKTLYLKERLRYPNINLSSIKGLVFDIHKFIEDNNLNKDKSLDKVKDFLHRNFIAFVTENKSIVVMRNINKSSSFPHYKLKIRDSGFLDYIKLGGYGFNSNQVILAEGIFDIFTESIYDNLGLKRSTNLYASVHSSNYSALLKSLSFHEQIFRMDVIILSDRGIGLDQYRKLKKYNRHIINSLNVYYNQTGKDFDEIPISPVKYII